MLLCLELGCLATTTDASLRMLLRVGSSAGRRRDVYGPQCHGPHWYQQEAHVTGPRTENFRRMPLLPSVLQSLARQFFSFFGCNRRGGRRHVRGRLPRGLLRRLRRAGGGAPGLLKTVVEQPPTPPLFGLAHTRF